MSDVCVETDEPRPDPEPDRPKADRRRWARDPAGDPAIERPILGMPLSLSAFANVSAVVVMLALFWGMIGFIQDTMRTMQKERVEDSHDRREEKRLFMEALGQERQHDEQQRRLTRLLIEATNDATLKTLSAVQELAKEVRALKEKKP